MPNSLNNGALFVSLRMTTELLSVSLSCAMIQNACINIQLLAQGGAIFNLLVLAIA